MAASERRYRGSTRSQKTERYADFVRDVWTKEPRLLRREVNERVQKHFGCGEVAADRAIKRFYGQLAEMRQDPGLADRVAAMYLDLAHEAKSEGKYRDSVRALDSLRAQLQLGGADRIEVSGGMTVTRNYEELSDEQLDALAKLDGGPKRMDADGDPSDGAAE